MNIKRPASAYTASVTEGLYEKVLASAKTINAMLMVNPNNADFKLFQQVVIAIGEIENVPPFFHPVVYLDKAYIDCRPFFNKEGNVRNLSEYTLLLRRALLDLLWVKNKEAYYPNSRFIIDAYSNWMSYGLQRTTGVSLIVTSYFKIVAGVFYLGLFNEEPIRSNKEETLAYIVKELSRILSVPAHLIYDVIAASENGILELYEMNITEIKIKPIMMLAAVMEKVTNGNVHIDQGVIRNAVCTGAIIAANAVEITAIALEHPPTFVAMMNTVMQRGIQQKTTLGTTLLGLSKKYSKDNFDKFIVMHASLELV